MVVFHECQMFHEVRNSENFKKGQETRGKGHKRRGPVGAGTCKVGSSTAVHVYACVCACV